MQTFISLGALAFVALAAVYFRSFQKLYSAICAEQPGWLQYKGEPSIFYTGMPRSLDPNVGVRVLAIAFSGKAHQLTPAAYHHAKIVRATLPSGLLVFASLLYVILAGFAA